MDGHCETCGFDPTEWDERDSANTVHLGDRFFAYVLDGASEGLAARPAPTPHEVMHQAVTLAAARHDGGDRVAPMSGTVARINASGGGVPKSSLPEAEVSRRGVIGDRQRNRQHHGRPWQALCLWSVDVIEALRAEGHPIEAGSAGENITMAGVDWSQMRSGLLVEIGSVLARVSTPAAPCRHNNRWFADGDSKRIEHERHPGWSRWYASVLHPGRVAAGDRVRVVAVARAVAVSRCLPGRVAAGDRVRVWSEGIGT